MSQRHARKRSSVSVKRRTTEERVASPKADSNLTLGSPYPSSSDADGEWGLSHSEEAGSMEKQLRYGLDSRAREITVEPHPGDLTTRPEIDLFDEAEEDEMVAGQASTTSAAPQPPTKSRIANDVDKQSSNASPRVPAKSPSQGVAAHVKAEALPIHLSQADTFARRQTTRDAPSSLTSSISSGARQMTLLNNTSNNGTSLPARSPSTSPSALRFQSSPIRRAPRGKRMSLNYIPSPASSKVTELDRVASYESATPSSVGTPVASAASHTSYFPKVDGTATGKNTASSTLMSSGGSASPSLARTPKKEDGDTVMTQHKDILQRIAEKERKIFELREGLAREEAELKELQQAWQTSVNKELLAHKAPSASTEESVSTGKPEVERPAASTSNKENVPPPNNVADGWKVLSARLAGAGTQLNAFIDQLAAPPDGDKKAEGAPKAANLRALTEEGENEDVAPQTPPKPLSRVQRANGSSDSSKRTSVFGASMAAIQKQVEALNGLESTESTPKADSSSANTGWSAWQKRLKEARENASGLLAKAEQRLGQALTVDDLANDSGVGSKSDTGNAAASRTSNSSMFDFSGENDREKAALAELSWLNSLAGINMSGTTDRVTTSLPTEMKVKRKNSDQAPARTSSESSNRRISNTSQQSKSSKARDATSPRPSLSAESDSSRKSTESTGFFSMLTNALSGADTDATEVEHSESTRTQDQRRSSSGQGKTRAAALMAIQAQNDRDPRSTSQSSIKGAMVPPHQSVKHITSSPGMGDDTAWGL